MASINSLSGGGSSSGIYGTRNVLSGLASGLDTESMIENAVSGYQMKLSALQQKKTKVEWEQEAYRSMITKMVGFSQKYTSYTSGTNLLSASFFDNATKVTTLGANASKISATGRTNSDVQINSVTRLAEAAKHTVESAAFSGNNVASKAVNIDSAVYVGLLDGNMTFSYGNKNIAISFGEKDGYQTVEEMAAAINKKLEDEVIAFDSGVQEKASERIKAEVVDGKITINKIKSDDSNTLKISSVSGNLDKALGIGKIDKDDTVTSFEFDAGKVSKKRYAMNMLREEGFTIKYNGETYKIDGPSTSEVNAVEGDDKTYAEKYIAALQGKIDEAMGAGKITVSNAFNGADSGGKKIQFQFTPANGSDEFTVTSPIAETLGMEGGLSNKVNLSRKLGDVIAGGLWKNGQEKKDSDGNVIKGSDGKPIIEYEFKLNDNSSIMVTKDMTLQELMDKMNSDEKSAVKMSYSEFTGKVTLSTKETGANQEIKLSGLSRALFVGDGKEGAVVLDQGENAKFYVSVNNEDAQLIERSSNTVDIDGMQITLKGTFGKAPSGEGEGNDAVQQSEGAANDEPVTFSFSSDSDKIVDAIKSMVADYNAMMSEVKEAYSTIPLKNSKGQDYMPLTDEDAADMSESAIANYEKKAKTGLLFADRDLSSFYSSMTEALRAFGVTGNDGSGIGITTSYSNGTTTLVVDESALRAALDSNPEKVRDVFVGKNGNGGVMQKMKNQLDTYAGTTGASKGILINKAGSTLAPTSIYQNTLQKEIDSFEDEIESWQDKIADKIDYYNKKFTTLEKLIAQMNNQSSMLGGLSGGY